MSIHVHSLVYSRKFGSATRKAVALKLADYASDDGTGIYPSLSRVAAEIEVHERTVRRVVREFEAEGILVVIKKGGRGPGHTTHWKLDLKAIEQLPQSWSKAGAVPSLERSRRTLDTNKADSLSKKGGRCVPQTIIEPSKEKKKDTTYPKKKRGSRIPESWEPDRDYAAAKGLPAPEIEREAEKFRNYWRAKPGQGGVKLDWAATWRNWVLTAVERRGQAPPRHYGGVSVSEAIADMAADMGVLGNG